MILFSILWNDILPLFVFIGAGWFLDSKFKIQISTYSKLTIWVVLPCFIFYTLYRYDGSGADVLLIPAALLLMVMQYGMAAFLGKGLGLSSEEAHGFRAVSTFSNSGHIGAALMILIYTHPPFGSGESSLYLAEAMGAMAVLMIVMNIGVNVFGAALIRSREARMSEFTGYLLKMPALYAAILAMACRMSGLSLESTFLWPVLQHFNGAFIVLITVTIGLELHRSRLKRPDIPILAAGAAKLLMAPFLAFCMITAGNRMGLEIRPVMAQVFFLYAAIPSSMALIIYSVEYKNHPDRITQSVLFNTVCGAFTVTIAIYLSRMLFPVGV